MHYAYAICSVQARGESPRPFTTLMIDLLLKRMAVGLETVVQRRRKGGCRGASPPCPFSKGQGGKIALL